MRMLSLKINILHALKNYFDNEKKVNLQFLIFPRRAHLAIESNGCVFALQKLSVTWQSRGIFLCIPFLAIVVQSVTTDTSDAFLLLLEKYLLVL